jgi:hypothetical protein
MLPRILLLAALLVPLGGCAEAGFVACDLGVDSSGCFPYTAHAPHHHHKARM